MRVAYATIELMFSSSIYLYKLQMDPSFWDDVGTLVGQYGILWLMR